MKNLLLIDDDEDDQEFFLSVIDAIDPSLSCVVAGNGKIALNHLIERSFKPDLIFLDLNMPGMSGKEFLSIVKSDSQLQSIPVVVLSTSADQQTISDSHKLGASRFMTKPNKLSLLEEGLRDVLHDFGLKDKNWLIG